MAKPAKAGPAGKPERPRTARGTLVLILAAVCGASLLAALLAFDNLPSTLGDNAEFAILGISLATGKGLRYVNHPEERPATKYPPGFPLMLAGWIKIFGSSVVDMKALVLACYVAAMGLAYLVARKLLDSSLSLLAAFLAISAYTVLSFSHQILSDIPYTLFSLIALLLILGDGRSRSRILAAMLIAVWAYFVRTVGISLVFAFAVFLFRRRMRREAIALIGLFAVVSVLWAIRNYTMTGEGSRYLDVLLSADPYAPDKGRVTLAGLATRGWTNLTTYVGHMLPLDLFPSLITYAGGAGSTVLRTLISVLITGVACFGGYALRKKAFVVNVYLLAYFAIYLGWPEVWKSERFMVPIAPIVGMYFLAGIHRILAYFEVKRVVIIVVCVVLVLSNIFSLGRFVRRERGDPPGWSKYLETAMWTRDNTPEDALVLCRKPFLFYVFSRRRTIAYPFTRDQEVMLQHLSESRPDYIILEDFGAGVSTTEVYLVPVLREMVAYLERVYFTGDPVNTVLRMNWEKALGK